MAQEDEQESKNEVAAATVPASGGELTADQLRERGAQIYTNSCADCHGARGEGVEGAYETPLVGDDSIGQVASLIAKTMPEGSPEECEGEDALAVAEYIHHAFYSEAAQVRNRPPRRLLSRLTATQLRQSISDLYSSFEGVRQPGKTNGVRGVYYAGDRARSSNLKVDRTDPQLDFDFGRESPVEGVEPEQFQIHWSGGLRADVSGRYEIVVHSTCSFVFVLGRDDREFINNHVQSGDKTEFRKFVNLTAGRVHPFKIRFTQRKRKTEIPPAKISLKWVPPGGTEQVIPSRNLTPDNAPSAYSLQADLPPDDRSYGFERGISVDRSWDESTTAVAVEFAQIAYEELWPWYQRRHKDEDDADRKILKQFLTELASHAFRRPLSEEMAQQYVLKHVAAEPDDGEAIKRVMLVCLKSPWFLYPQLDSDQSQSQQAGNRMALVLFDSLPTNSDFRKLALEQKLESDEQIRGAAQRIISDYRVQAKTRQMLLSWLNAGHFGEIAKSSERFPEFDKELVSDSYQSLLTFLDHVVWSPESDFRQLWFARQNFTTERMAQYYGTAWELAEMPPLNAEETGGEDSGDEGTGVSVARASGLTSESEAPNGLLTHPYLMSGLAYEDSTSPIHRGVFLYRYVLGRTLRPPSEAFTPLSPDLHPDLTTRQRVDLQTSPESCQVCHAKINGLGFTLENYAADGRFRAQERDQAVDARGSYTSRNGDQVEFSGPQELVEYIANSEEAHRAFVARAFQYFVKQPPAAYGADTLDRLTQRFREQDCSIRKLIIEIAVVAARPPTLDTSPTGSETAGLD